MIRVVGILIVSGTLAAASSAAGSASHPALRLSGADPIAVRGTAFHAREQVRLTLATMGKKRTKRVLTNGTGTFRTTFDLETPYDPCNGALIVVARGASGDSASAKYVGRECPPAP